MFFIMYERVRLRPMRKRTVYGDGNALGQLVSICAHKRWHESKLVELQILGAQRPLGHVGVNDLEVKLICLGNSSNGCGTWVPLQKSYS